MESLHLAYALLGAGGVLLALVSHKLPELPVTEPLLALLLGVVLGPQLLDVFELEPALRDPLLLEGARFLLAASVMTAALRYPAVELRSLWRPVLLLVAVVMPLAAVLTGAAALMLGLPLALAAVVGACLCPTDPVLAASIVSGDAAERDLPARVRRMLTTESGSNDGLALPLVSLALIAAVGPSASGTTVATLVWEVLGAVAVGVATGVLAGYAMRLADRHGEISHGALLVYTLLLTVAVLGLARIAGTDGVLAVYVAGLAYNRSVGRSERAPQSSVDEALNHYLVLPLFVLLGLVLPWQEWVAFGPVAVLFVLAVLVVRRLPAVLLLRRGLGLGGREAAFIGWFGPMGVSAVFYLAHSMDSGVSDPRLLAAGSLAVVASVVAHGVTMAPFRTWYARSA